MGIMIETTLFLELVTNRQTFETHSFFGVFVPKTHGSEFHSVRTERIRKPLMITDKEE